jgi:VanZ family protein
MMLVYNLPQVERFSRFSGALTASRCTADCAIASLMRRLIFVSMRESITVNDDLKSRFRAGAKVCSVAIVVLLVIGALGPASWTPRTAFGWRIDHFIGYFSITLLFCFAWPQPSVVGGLLAAAAFLLEGLQAFSPGRSANLVAALCSAGGVLAGALVAELFIRASRWHLKGARDAE